MIVSKEAQEKLATDYFDKAKNAGELSAFIDGMQQALNLVDKILTEQNQVR
jgi:hypothetical protein